MGFQWDKHKNNSLKPQDPELSYFVCIKVLFINPANRTPGVHTCHAHGHHGKTKTYKILQNHKLGPELSCFVSLREIFFQLLDSCLADCKILLDKTQFCRTVLYVIIKTVVIFARHLSDKIKYFVSRNEILLVLTDRPALFVKTVLCVAMFSGPLYAC